MGWMMKPLQGLPECSSRYLIDSTLCRVDTRFGDDSQGSRAGGNLGLDDKTSSRFAGAFVTLAQLHLSHAQILDGPADRIIVICGERNSDLDLRGR